MIDLQQKTAHNGGGTRAEIVSVVDDGEMRVCKGCDEEVDGIENVTDRGLIGLDVAHKVFVCPSRGLARMFAPVASVGRAANDAILKETDGHGIANRIALAIRTALAVRIETVYDERGHAAKVDDGQGTGSWYHCGIDGCFCTLEWCNGEGKIFDHLALEMESLQHGSKGCCKELSLAV